MFCLSASLKRAISRLKASIDFLTHLNCANTHIKYQSNQIKFEISTLCVSLVWINKYLCWAHIGFSLHIDTLISEQFSFVFLLITCCCTVFVWNVCMHIGSLSAVCTNKRHIENYVEFSDYFIEGLAIGTTSRIVEFLTINSWILVHSSHSTMTLSTHIVAIIW